MIAAPIPERDEERVQALRRLLLLDTPAEERFDRVVEFAAAEFEAPIVLISLVDARRQWFKARHGLPVVQTPRDVSFCAHSILSPGDLLVVPDARKDVRFHDNPLVTGAPFIRFYAGAPLVLPDSAAAVGTLCLIDSEPREGLDTIDCAMLRALRDVVVEELVRRPHEELR